jgi:hypothetical protein
MDLMAGSQLASLIHLNLYNIHVLDVENTNRRLEAPYSVNLYTVFLSYHTAYL